MANEEKKSESADAGSSGASPELAVDPNKIGDESGQSTQKTSQATDEGKKEEVVPKSQYAELETKLGEQGKELGDARNFIDQVSPLLNKLEGRADAQELVKAIMDDKITPEFVESVMKGKVSQEEAEATTKAHQEVKEELGKKEYAKATPEQIEELVSKKIAESEKKLNERLTEAEQERNFQKEVDDFIARTPDFPEYAAAVEQYVEDKGLDDIEVAYHAVKGMKIAKEAEKKKQEEEGENAKNVAANAGGGGVQSTQVITDSDMIDKLVGKRPNPNLLG